MDVERLINRHKDTVYRQMIRVCGNRDDAEDALANAIFTALRASDQLREPGNFQAWLSRIGSRACSRMRIRDRLVHLTSLEELRSKGFDLADPSHDTSQEAQTATLKDCVLGAIESLPETFRAVYLMREIAGDRAEDVANALHLSIPAVKSRLHRARQLMRTALDSGLGCSSLAD